MKKIISFILLIFMFFLTPFFVSAKENDQITLYFFHGDDCPHCAEEEKFLSSNLSKYSNLKIERLEVWYNMENSALLNKVESALDIKRSGVPTTIIGNIVISGYSDSIGSKIERAVEFYEENEYVDVVKQIKDGSYVKPKEEEEEVNDEFSKEEEKSDEAVTIGLPVFGNINLKNISLMSAAVIIGLIDGFNPCAMWILLFLISVLIGMKDRKRMWTLGLTFLVTSALVYMFIMLSWINVAVKITAVVWIRNLIALVALIGGIINIRSFLTSSDSGCNVVDERKRKKIFKKIRKFTSEKSFILALLGVIGLAISVNLVELACSAGLPLVFSELLALNNVSSFMKFMYTVLYILFFLLDDLIVFFIAMFTMKVTGISTRYNRLSHLLGGFIMLLIGILLLVRPEWLMFNWR